MKLKVTGISTSSNYAAVNAYDTTLSVGTSCMPSFTFMPTSSGTMNGSALISSTAISTPHPITLTGMGTDFKLETASGGSTTATVTAGQTATYSLEVMPTAFTGTISLSCTGAPLRAACSVPASVTLDGTHASTFKATVTTAARSVVPPPPPPAGPFNFSPVLWLLPLVLAGGLLIPAKRRTQVALAASLLLILTWVACGGGGSSSSTMTTSTGTPSGSYSLLVTATAGTATRTMTLTLHVN